MDYRLQRTGPGTGFEGYVAGKHISSWLLRVHPTDTEQAFVNSDVKNGDGQRRFVGWTGKGWQILQQDYSEKEYWRWLPEVYETVELVLVVLRMEGYK